MSEAQLDLEEFHVLMGDDVTLPPGIRDEELRIRLMEEELAEVIEAIGEGDIFHVAKELADLLYVVYGTAVRFGIWMDDVFEAVHQSNMSKFEGAKWREDGKLLKGPHYKPADDEVQRIIKKQMQGAP